MGSLSTWFGWSVSTSHDELPDIYPMPILQKDYVSIDVFNIYSKILTDVIDRVFGLTDDQQSLLWDNCLASENSKGLVSMLAEAMSMKRDLFLKLDSGILRKATAAEESQIREDYKLQAYSEVGTYVSFKNYERTDLIRLYSAMEYCTVSALNKSMNLSKAIQFKMNDLRASTSLVDKAEVKTQALAIAQGLGAGKDALMDSKDMIETSFPDLNPIKESINFLNQKRSFYLGLPESYISGIQTGGLNTTGEGDQKAIERGLKSYYQSIVKPVLKSLFNATVSYKSQDFRQIDNALKALQTFDLVSDQLITFDQKQKVINSLFDIENDEALEAD